jgi:hypothetical protein
MTSPFAELVGTEFGVNEWIETKQESVDSYANMLRDIYWPTEGSGEPAAIAELLAFVKWAP